MRLFFLLVACAAPAADSGDAGTDPCADRPRVSWDGFADGFFGGYCRPCHSVETQDRYGAPEGLDFDTEDQARGLASSVQRAVLDEGTMPVGGGVTEDDAALLSAWLDCAVGAR